MKLSANILFLIAVFVTGCDSQIKEFIGKRSQKRPVSSTAGSKHGYKISPAAGQMFGTQVNTQYAITHSKLKIKGSQVNATISIQGRSID